MEKWSIYLLKIVCSDLKIKLVIKNKYVKGYHHCIKYESENKRILRYLYFYPKYLTVLKNL